MAKTIELETTNVVRCPKGDGAFMGKITTLDKCEDCDFYGGLSEDGVSCLYDKTISEFHFNATRIEDRNYVYELRDAKSLNKQDYDKYIESDDKCKFCCFLQELKNGYSYCKLRYGITDGMVMDPFICAENEFWVQKHKEKGEE